MKTIMFAIMAMALCASCTNYKVKNPKKIQGHHFTYTNGGNYYTTTNVFDNGKPFAENVSVPKEIRIEFVSGEVQPDSIITGHSLSNVKVSPKKKELYQLSELRGAVMDWGYSFDPNTKDFRKFTRNYEDHVPRLCLIACIILVIIMTIVVFEIFVNVNDFSRVFEFITFIFVLAFISYLFSYPFPKGYMITDFLKIFLGSFFGFIILIFILSIKKPIKKS